MAFACYVCTYISLVHNALWHGHTWLSVWWIHDVNGVLKCYMQEYMPKQMTK